MRGRFVLYATLPALVALACNALLGNESGVFVDGSETGPGSSSGNGSSGSSGVAPDGGSSSGNASSSSSSGGPVDAGPCRCAEGCPLESYPTLCTPEDVPVLGLDPVTGLAATADALYVARGPGVRVERIPLDGDPGTTYVEHRVAVVAAAEAVQGEEPDVLFVLDDDAGRVRGFAGGGDVEVDLRWPPSLRALQLESAAGAVVSYALPEAGAAALVLAYSDERNPGSNFATRLDQIFLTASARGVYWAAKEPPESPPRVRLIPTTGAPSVLTFADDAGPIEGMTASESGLFVTGPCAPRGVCALGLTDAGPSTVLAVSDPYRVSALYAATQMLLWTEREVLTGAETTYQCVATDCAASRAQLGSGGLLAAARNGSHVYFALSGNVVGRLQRVF